jgi:hypothetical protein
MAHSSCFDNTFFWHNVLSKTHPLITCGIEIAANFLIFPSLIFLWKQKACNSVTCCVIHDVCTVRHWNSESLVFVQIHQAWLFLTIFVDFGVAKIVAQKIVKLFLRLALDWTTSNSRELPMVFSTVYCWFG